MPSYSRKGQTSPLGKCTDEIKSLVPEEVKAQLTGLSVLNGVPLSEYVRDVLIEHVYGAAHAMRLRAGLPIRREGNGQV